MRKNILLVALVICSTFTGCSSTNHVELKSTVRESIVEETETRDVKEDVYENVTLPVVFPDYHSV